MKKTMLILVPVLLAFLIACEQEDITPRIQENPFDTDSSWNGFVINETPYATPNAIIEIYGENLDNLSADFDVSLTDGTFSYTSRTIVDYTVLLYFDANSPDIQSLSPGIYTIENTPYREPGNIVESYILLSSATTVIKYPILAGEVEIKTQNGFYLVEYTLKTIVDREEADVYGRYSGMYTIVDQRDL